LKAVAILSQLLPRMIEHRWRPVEAVDRAGREALQQRTRQ
jgi:hypothetical protein